MKHTLDRRYFDEDDAGDEPIGPPPVDREAAGTATTEEFRRAPSQEAAGENDDYSPENTGEEDPAGILDVTDEQIAAAAKKYRRPADEDAGQEKTETAEDEAATETVDEFINDEVRSLAGQYQITDEELATIGSRDEFDRLLTIMDRAFVKSGEAQRGGATQETKPAADGKPPAEKTGEEKKPAAETEIPAEALLKPYVPTLDAEEMPEIHQELTKLSNHLFAQVRKLAQIVQPVVMRTSKQVEDELTAKFDACVSKIPATFRKAIGPAGYNSLPEKSPHRETQDKIAVVMGDLMRGAQARGARMSFETAFERAYRSVLGKQTETIVRDEILDKARERTKSMTHRPGRVTGAGRSVRDQAVEAVKKTAHEKGLTEALAPAGEQDLSAFL